MIDLKAAASFAKALGALDNFPQFTEAVTQITLQIQGLCPTEADAEWLVNECTISGKYSRWQGPGWLHDVYTSRDKLPPGALPRYDLDKSYEPMTDQERADYAEMERQWQLKAKAKLMPEPRNPPRELTAEELEKLKPWSVQ